MFKNRKLNPKKFKNQEHQLISIYESIGVFVIGMETSADRYRNKSIKIWKIVMSGKPTIITIKSLAFQASVFHHFKFSEA